MTLHRRVDNEGAWKAGSRLHLDAAPSSYPRGPRGSVTEDLKGQMGKWGDLWPPRDSGG